MRKLNSQTRGVRQWLLCLVVFLLQSVGTWAEPLILDGDPYSLMNYNRDLKPVTDALFISNYGLMVNYETVTDENAEDILGDGSLSYDPETKTLTMRNAMIEGNVQWSNAADLNICIVGDNRIYDCIEGSGSGKLIVLRDPAGADCSLTIDRRYDYCISGFTDVEANGLNISTAQTNGMYPDGSAGNTDGNPVFRSVKVMFTTATLYDIWLGLEQVTSANKDNILDDTTEDDAPTAYYDVENNVLTLNNAHFGEAMEMMTPSFIIGTDLTVYLIGESEFYGDELKVTSNHIATFTTDSLNPGKLMVWRISGNVAFQNGLDFFWSEDEQGYIGIDQSEHYDLWVAGKQVTANIANNILGDYTVSWDQESQTLYLNEANIQGNIVSGLSNGFNICLYGRNIITTNEVAFNSTPKGWQPITITAEEGGMLITNKTEEENLFSDYNSGRMWTPDLPENYVISRDMNGQLSIARHYDLYLQSMIGTHFGQQYVTEANCDRLLGTNGTATVTYDPDTDVLTLNNMQEVSAAPYGTTYFINKEGYDATVTINLVGENVLENYADVGDVSIAYGSNIVFTTDEEVPGSLTVTHMANESYIDKDYMFSGNVIFQNGLQYFKDDQGNHYIKVTEKVTNYPIWIAETQITSENAADVRGDGTISYDSKNHTLTFNNAQFTVDTSAAVTFGDDNEPTIVELKGRNIIIAYEMGFFNSSETNHTIVFATDEEQPGTLVMPFQTADNMFGQHLTVQYQNTLELVGDNQVLPYVDQPHVGISDFSICYNGKKVGVDANSPVYYSLVPASMLTSEEQPEFLLYSDSVQLNETGMFYLMAYAMHPLAGDNPDMKSTTVYAAVEVVDSITFSLKPGSYRGTQRLYLGNLPQPSEIADGETTQPQVWYYFGGQGKGAKACLYDEDEGIELTESTTLSVFVAEQYERLVCSDTITVAYEIEQIPSYGLWVGDIQVNIDNRSNVVGDADATVKFDGKHTLVLNKAMLQVPISTTLDSLTIYLVGDNSIATSEDAPFVNLQTDQTAELTFTGNANSPGVLTVQSGDGPLAKDFHLNFEYNLCVDTVSAGLYLVSVPLVPLPLDDTGDGGEDHHTVTIDFSSDDFLTPDGDDIDLTNIVINNVLFTLSDSSNPDGSGFDNGELLGDHEPGIVLNTEMGTIILNEAMNYEPGSSAFANLFSGMTFVVPAGSGTITLDAFTAEGSYLGVKIGANDPIYLTGLQLHQKVEIHFECLMPTFVFIFNASPAVADSRGFKGGKKTSVHVKVYDTQVTAESMISVNSEEGVLDGLDEPVRMFALGSTNYVDNGRGIVINKVMGRAITELSDDLFRQIDQNKVKYIDLSETAVPSLTANRSEGVFGGLSNNILLLLPSEDANDGGQPNVVINGQCNQLVLSSDMEKGGFLTPCDFTAGVVELDRMFVPGQPTSLYLPFDLTATQLAQLGAAYSFTEVDGEWAHFDQPETSGTKANEPYLLLPAAEQQLHAENVQVKRLPQSLSALPVQLRGTYLPVEWLPDEPALYRLTTTGGDTRFVRMAQGDAIAPFDIYLTAAEAAAQLNIYINGVTRMQSPRMTVRGVGEWYTLDGRRVEAKSAAFQKGVYIHQGKKVVVK